MTVQQNGVSVLDDVGIIVPPPEVKEILETTASFVGKKPAFEARLLQERENDPRFTFLNATDPYHAYYRSKVDEVRLASKNNTKPIGLSDTAHGGGQAPNSQENGTQPSTNSDQKATDADAGKKEEKDPKNTTHGEAVVSFLKSVEVKEAAARREPREPPSDDLFTIINVNPPPHALGLDVMKLTAQYVATHGSDFQTELGSKESRNSLFDFLKPLHPHFIVFQRLVDSYKALLTTGEEKEELVRKFASQAANEQSILDEVWYMHDWECQRAEREHEAMLDESERLKVAQIDWHDFVVLETVEIDENEVDLPAPVADARQLPKILAAAQKAELVREKNRGDVDMEIDQGVDTGPMRGGAVVTANVDSDIPADRIRKRAAPMASMEDGRDETTVLLPSGQLLEGLEAAERSMRAELLNPSYKSERERAARKDRLQNLAGGEEMARNLARLRGGETGKVGGVGLESGPKLPGEMEVVAGPVKRARVEAAVGMLSGAGRKEVGEEVEKEIEKGGMEGKIGPEEWMKKVGGTAMVRILVPTHVNREWNLEGQEMEMSAKLKSNVGKLKTVICKYTKLPVNKQKLLLEGVGFLKDSMSLAWYNVKDGDVIRLEVKERGGRRKHG